MQPNFPVISSNLVLANGVFGTADPYVSGAVNNGALNPLGGLYFLNAGEGGLQSNQYLTAATSKGAGSGLWVKYCLYKSTDTTAVKAGPAPVYWTDETYTQVTDLESEGQTTGLNSIAGWLLPNTTALGSTAFTMTILRNGGNGSYVFIGISGFIAGAFVGSAAIGGALIGSATAWTPGTTAANTAPTNKVIGWVISTPSSNLADIEAVGSLF